MRSSLAPLHLKSENERCLLFIEIARDSRNNNPQVAITDAPFAEIEEKSCMMPWHHRRSLNIFSRKYRWVALYPDGFIPSEYFRCKFRG